VRLFRTLRKLSSWNINPKHALAMSRHFLIPYFGRMAALAWARLILGCFRDALLPDFNPLLALALSSIPLATWEDRIQKPEKWVPGF